MPHLVLATLLFVSSCLPVGGGGGSDFYRSDPRYTAGVPFTTVDPRTGATLIVPGSPLRAHWAMEPYRAAGRIYGTGPRHHR